jgi:hypothetical protein
MRSRILRIALVTLAALGIAAFAVSQLREAIKIIGVTAAVRQFGPEMNRALNRMIKHTDTSDDFTKVVPIVTIGIRSRGAIGAAQIRGARRNVEEVRAVAAPETQIFGREIMIRALIPISTDRPDSIENLKPVQGVGVSGIIDLKL